MPTVAINPMTIGQTQRVHVKDYGADQAHNPSQTEDTTSSLVVGSATPGVASISVAPDDSRAVIVTAVGAGAGTLIVNEAPSVPVGSNLILNVSVAAAPIDNRRIDFVSADSPV